MSNDSDSFDPTDESERTIGQGVFEEEMGPGSSFAHLYRGEVYRMRFWRERLDRTTHWAIIVIAAILTWSFSSRTRPHYIILMGIAILTVFLLIEARRFRGYEVWRSRVRTLQKNVFGYGLDPSRDLPDPGWREALSEDYRTPTVTISIEESLAHRLRRVYFPLYCLLGAAWIIRITGFAMASWPQSAMIAGIPGDVVTALVAAFYLLIGAIAYRPRTWHVAGEIQGAEHGAWDERW
jgi:uncharacterized membrane protein